MEVEEENDTVGQPDMSSKPLEMDICDSSWRDEGIVIHEVVYVSKQYPIYLERYVLQSLPRAQLLFSPIGFMYTVDPYSKLMTLSTTRKEPKALRKAKEFLQLVAVHCPVELAFTIFTDQLSSFVIHIWRHGGGLCKDLNISKEQLREREKLFEASIEALKDLTSCKIIMSPSTIVVIGKSEGVKMIRNMARDCFVSNESPVPKIRTEIARKLEHALSRRLNGIKN